MLCSVDKFPSARLAYSLAFSADAFASAAAVPAVSPSFRICVTVFPAVCAYALISSVVVFASSAASFASWAASFASSASCFACSARSWTSAAASAASVAFVSAATAVSSALSATCRATFARAFPTSASVSSVGGAVLLPTSHAVPPETRTCTVSPAAASIVSATGVSSTPPGMWTNAVPFSTRRTVAVVSYASGSFSLLLNIKSQTFAAALFIESSAILVSSVKSTFPDAL